jgi:RNA polymerase sigma-70 factor (ECF subfamily)
MYKKANDYTLVEASQTGDEEAFAELVNRYKDYAYAIALNCVKNEHHAEDVVQEAFLKLIGSLKTFRKKSKFSTWLYSLVYFTAVDWLRKNTRLKTEELNTEIDQTVQSEHISSAVVEGKIKNEYLQKALRLLTEDEATILSLFYFMNQSLNEIAVIMNIQNTNTIKTKLSRARSNLKQTLDILVKGNSKDML